MKKIQSHLIYCRMQLFPMTSISDVNPNYPVMKRRYAASVRICQAYTQLHHKKTGAIENCKFNFMNNFAGF
jgi:hypothetical protein